ncbi:DUF2142 domain-containing protein [Paraburkholderia sp. DGU8]|uniref:DUF2142 domain-containing protein n=1 Tax=Paraburkholderia sp. DGU8 TaxID=3161997 RepID=UPI00346536B8
MSHFQRSAIALFSIIIIGSILSALIPPMQSPDEIGHTDRAYLLSILSHTRTLPQLSTGGDVDDALQQYQATWAQALAAKPDARVSRETAQQTSKIRWAHERDYTGLSGAAPYFPLGYLPQALGFRIGQTLDLGVGTSYRLARFAALTAVATIIAYAFSIFPPNALVICLLALPMTMFQISSASADGMSFAWTVLAGSLFRVGMQRDEVFSAWKGALLILSAFMLVTSRPQMAGVLVLPSAVFLVRNDKRALVASVVSSVAAVGWVGYAMSSNVDFRLTRSVTSKQAVEFYAHHPSDLVGITWRTVTDHAVIRDYWREFVGILGWLDRPMPAVAYEVAGAALVCAVAISFSRRIGGATRALAVMAAMLAVPLTFMALLMSWTDLPADVINGVQGRYFIAPALLAACVLGARDTSKRRNWAALVLSGAFIAFSTTMTVSTLLWKYYL